MFDSKYIHENIDIIFEREHHNLKLFKPFCYVADIKKGLENFDLSIEDKYHLEWETYNTLKQLFNKIETSAESRKIFIDYIKDKMMESKCYNLSYYKQNDYMDEQNEYQACYFMQALIEHFEQRGNEQKSIKLVNQLAEKHLNKWDEVTA